jgi:hypothetical protein
VTIASIGTWHVTVSARPVSCVVATSDVLNLTHFAVTG